MSKSSLLLLTSSTTSLLYSTSLLLILLFSSTTCFHQAVDAQTSVVNPSGDGITTTVNGILITKSLFYNASELIARFVPYYYSNTQLGTTNATDNFILVHTNERSAKPGEWNQVWEFNETESSTIRAWLITFPTLRNNFQMRINATWYGGRFLVTPTLPTWRIYQQSLMPYGLLDTCNITEQVQDYRQLLATVPRPCLSDIVPAARGFARRTGNCLLMHGKRAVDMYTACNTLRAIFTTAYCTDGEGGVTEMCSYYTDFRPNGIAGAMVTTVGADGLPTSGRMASPPRTSSAGKLSSFFCLFFVSLIFFGFFLF